MFKQKEYNISQGKKPKNLINAVDLFCGVGGLTRGLEKSGITVNLGVDIDPACEYAYTENNNAHFLLKLVEEVKESDFGSTYNKSKYRLLAGCAPCQTFSTYNQKSDFSDKRWWLLLQFTRLILETTPELVTMENVPGLIRQGVFKTFIDKLKEQNYYVDFKVVNCADYGIPQQRKRLVLLASRLGEISLISSKKLKIQKKTVRDVIGSLPSIRAGETHQRDPLHQSASLSQTNMERIKNSRPSGTWRDWDEYLIADCHKKKSGQTYLNIYGRMSWDEPSPTINNSILWFW